MKKQFGKNRKCKRCGGDPVLHIVPCFGLVGFVCRRCAVHCKMFTSMAEARKYWNRRNKG